MHVSAAAVFLKSFVLKSESVCSQATAMPLSVRLEIVLVALALGQPGPGPGPGAGNYSSGSGGPSPPPAAADDPSGLASNLAQALWLWARGNNMAPPGPGGPAKWQCASCG